MSLTSPLAAFISLGFGLIWLILAFLLIRKAKFIWEKLLAILLLVLFQFSLVAGATLFLNARMHYFETPSQLLGLLKGQTSEVSTSELNKALENTHNLAQDSQSSSPVPEAKDRNQGNGTGKTSFNDESASTARTNDSGIGNANTNSQNYQQPRQLTTNLPASWKAKWNPSSVDGPQVKQTIWRSPHTGAKGLVQVWLPRGYKPNDGKTYAGIIFYHGTPGSPYGLVKALGLSSKLQKAIDTKKIPPAIVILPDLRTPSGGNPDCIDLPGKNPVFSWATSDMVSLAHANFPNITTDRRGWIISGLSAGAWCATRSAILRPDLFQTVIAMSGYDQPELGVLSTASKQVREDESLSHLITRPRRLPLWFYLSGTWADNDSATVVERLKNNHLKQDIVYGYLGKEGGHNWGLWNKMFFSGLTWWQEQIETSKAKIFG